MPAQYWLAPITTPTAQATSGTALASAATADISPTPQATTVAGQLYTGAVIRFTAWGVYTSTTGTNNLTLGAFYGGTAGVALATTGAVGVTASQTNDSWRLEIYTIIRSIGTSGTAFSQGFWQTSTALHRPIPNVANTSTVTIDTTVAKTLTIGATWSAASNSVTCNGCLIETVG